MPNESTNAAGNIHRQHGTTDVFTPEKRSEIMSRVRSKDTKPELAVRSLLHAMGYRFRVHRTELPGKPDIVLPKYRTVVFVHGCFWHQHPDCRKATLPKRNAEFWREKLEGNAERDRRTYERLRELGWHVLVVWECEVQREWNSLPERLDKRLRGSIDPETGRPGGLQTDNRYTSVTLTSGS